MQHAYDSQFMNYADQSSRHSARVVSNLLKRELQIASVLDVGCAKGTWLKAWLESGVVEYAGVDGNYVSTDDLVIPAGCFTAADLSQPINLQRKFDLVQSLEVAEHLPATAADQFIRNLVLHSTGIVLFSAAPPGQGGEHHINEQPFEYWRAKFREHGFFAYDYLRPSIADDLSVSFWYRFNILLYVREDVQAGLPEAIRTTRVPDQQAVVDVSPIWFRARKFVIRQLPHAWQQSLARLKAHSWRAR